MTMTRDASGLSRLRPGDHLAAWTVVGGLFLLLFLS
jgi:hypothetical protein